MKKKRLHNYGRRNDKKMLAYAAANGVGAFVPRLRPPAEGKRRSMAFGRPLTIRWALAEKPAKDVPQD